MFSMQLEGFRSETEARSLRNELKNWVYDVYESTLDHYSL